MELGGQFSTSHPGKNMHINKASLIWPVVSSWLQFFFYLIFVSLRSIAGYQFSDESGKEELCTDNHGCKSQIEIRTVCNQSVRITGIQVVQLVDSYDSYSYETENKHDRTQEAEDMHRLDTEFRQEPECEQVQITVDETVQSEFCLSVFSCLVVNHFFAYLAETGIFAR